ncbi:MAG: hypothetical protein JWO80_1565 [Bryobacterales bacterium]|nr:hypothetical protein [Bryobacterales bacterium]
MAISTAVSVADYLATSYEDGDREYVDGEVLERHVGELDHGNVQGNIYFYLRMKYEHLIWAGPEIRVQVKPSRFRVPDVTVMLGRKPSGAIIVQPPFIAIEVLSREDRAVDLQAKIQDYLEFGVVYVWVLNPITCTAATYTPNGVVSHRDGVLRTENPEIVVPLSSIF